MTDKQLSFVGERAAISGYWAQYIEFGIRVYNALIARDLVEIRVADMEKNVGKLDDICYVTGYEVHGYQVKWSNAGASFKYSDFLDVIGGLADGWRKLRDVYPGKRVYAHLLTNRRCSSRDHIKGADGSVVGHFNEFVEEALPRLHSVSRVQVGKGRRRGTRLDSKWETVVKELQGKTGLCGSDWTSFWKAFVFTPDYEQEAICVMDSMSVKRTDDVLRLMALIQEEVADKKGRIILSSSEIERLFNGRVGTTYNHNLSAPVERFALNKKAVGLLNSALVGKSGGYILLQGSPGSGKSTVLTQWVESLPNKSVRYYAFDFLNPSSNRNSESDRGDCVTFLYDMVTMLHQIGFRASAGDGGDTLPYRDYHFLKKYFYALLEDASSYYQASGLPLVIVVDGLDHITREYARQNHGLCSLLTVLPSMSDLPQGVVFVLGSQHYDFEDLHYSIRSQAVPEASLITMPLFDREEVEALLLKSLPGLDVDTRLVDKSQQLSQGHPLYLSYIINQLREKGVSALDSIVAFSGDVEDYYRRLLDKNTLLSLVDVLGLLCRVPGRVPLEYLDVWGVSREQKQRLAELRHLFRFDGKSISFFHNSFRQYLIYKTAEDPFVPGKLCEKDDRAFYARLYELASSDWNAGFYLYQAGKYDEFIGKITPDALFLQLQEFRPLWSVRQDLGYGVEIARKRRDPYLLARYILFESQLVQMGGRQISVLSLVKDFLKMGEVSLAKRLVRDDNGLCCSQSRALSLVKEYALAGVEPEAKALFELGYPSFMNRRVDPRSKSWVRDDVDMEAWAALACNWVSAAIYCGCSLGYIRGHVIKFRHQLTSFARHYGIEFDDRDFWEQLKSEYVYTLIECHRWDDLTSFMTDADTRPVDPFVRLYVWEQAIISALEVERNDSSLIQGYYQQMVDLLPELKEDEIQYLQMAFVSQKIGKDATTIDSYLSHVSWKSLGSFYLSSGEEFSKFYNHLCYARLRAFLGYTDKVASYAPEDNSKEDYPTMYYYARRVFKLAQYLGKAQAGHVDGRAFLSDADDFFKSFDNLPHNMRNIYSYTISRQREDFYEYLVEVAVGLGEGVLSHLADKVEAYFSSYQCKADANAKRSTILALARNGIPAAQCIRMLEQMALGMMNDQDVEGRMEQARNQGRAWLEFHKEGLAMQCFQKMILESFGVGYRKDYQPSVMAEWIGAAIKNNPEGADERIQWLTSRLKYLSSSTESDKIARYAVRSLLPQVLDYNLGAGVKLAKWMLDEQWCSYQTVLAKLLVALIRQSNTDGELNLIAGTVNRLYFYTLDDASSDLSDTTNEVLESLVEQVLQLPAVKSSQFFDKLRSEIKIWALPTLSTILLTQLDGLLSSSPATDDDRVRDSDAAVADARQLMANGQTEAAWDKASEALALSSNYGWDRWSDGGTRLNASIALVQIDKEKGREIVFGKIADDVSKGHTIGMRNYLSEIIPLLTDSIDQERLFMEEWEYMNRILREDTVALEDRPDVSPESVGLIEALSIFLVYTADLPVMAISEQAKMLLALYVDAGYSVIPLLCRSGRSEELQLETGMFLRALQSPRLSAFKECAKKAAISNNYLHRLYAKMILDTLGEQVPVPPYRPLPATYNLVFPSASDLASLSTAQRLSILAGTEFPSASSTMRIGSHITGYLSEITGIPVLTLEVRAETLMKQKPSSRQYHNTEVHLRNIWLRFTYRKDGVLEALDSISEVVAELIDAHRIQADDEVLEDVVRPYDFDAILIHPEEKPAFIDLIQTKDNWSLPANWRNSAQHSSRLDGNLRQLDGKYVLAEFTYLSKPITEDDASEEFKSKLSFYDKQGDAANFFGDAPYQRQSEDYLDVGEEDSQIIVWRNGRLIVGSHLSRWIAINPACARALGWKPAADGLFAWNDSTGAPVVRSIYWHSGNPTCKSHFCHPTAEGWLVLATPDALTQLQEFASTNGHPLHLHQSLTRAQHSISAPKNAYRIVKLSV